jgi:hypothetical protein
MCPKWARSGWNALPQSIWFGTQGIRRFAQRTDCDTKVRNVSRVGPKIGWPKRFTGFNQARVVKMKVWTLCVKHVSRLCLI